MGRFRAGVAFVSLSFLVCCFSCQTSRREVPVTISASESLEPGIQIAVDDLAQDIEKISGRKVARAANGGASCVPGEIQLVVRGIEPGVAGDPSSHLEEQAYEIAEERCDGGGKRIALRGGGLLSAQWAIYDLLGRLGVRYFHPEQTYYPTRLEWPADPIRVVERPAFRLRMLYPHRAHPIELSPPLEPGNLDMAGYQRRWIDWNVKLRQNLASGADGDLVGDYHFKRGFPWSGGISLVNRQQGGRPLLDPEDRRPESEQIAAAIEQQLAPRPGLAPPWAFGIQFNPDEFTTVDDVKTVERLRFFADYMGTHHPNIELYTINHGTAGRPTPTYGVRFFDLPEFAPPNLGVNVHPLMFYDLDRAAPVYGNTDFSHMLRWMRREATVRRIVHFPEASWWLTFDLPVPLYLAPVTLDARQRDIDLLRDLVTSDPAAKKGVQGHQLFGSGQEWGYWLVDWCVARMTWDLSYTHARCLDDFTSTFERGDELRSVLREVEAAQLRDMRDPEIIRFLVGSDDATETAFQAGIVFHPLPPAFAEVIGWDDGRVAGMETRSLAPLRRMAEDYRRWAGRVDAVAERQSADKASWVREIRDGLSVFGLRAAHAVAVYETALALRSALKANDVRAVTAARAGLSRVQAVTEDARRVIRAREADYRYPAALTILGDEAGTPGAIPNKTIYPYRYLSRTHRLFYWERPNAQLAALFEAEGSRVTAEKGVVKLGSSLDLRIFVDGVRRIEVDWGDGEAQSSSRTHNYARQGFFDWRAKVEHASGTVDSGGRVAVAARRIFFARGSLTVAAPPGAEIIANALPGFEIGLGDDGAPFFAVRTIGPEDGPALRVARRDRDGLASAAGDLEIPLGAYGSITLRGARFEIVEAVGIATRRLVVAGGLSTDEIAALVVRVGGFDAEGARRAVAGLLGYTPTTLPAIIDVRIEGSADEDP